jgi:hypothetical protein
VTREDRRRRLPTVINPTPTSHFQSCRDILEADQSSSPLALASFFSLAGLAAFSSRSFSPSTLCLGSGTGSSGTTRFGVSRFAPAIGLCQQITPRSSKRKKCNRSPANTNLPSTSGCGGATPAAAACSCTCGGSAPGGKRTSLPSASMTRVRVS